MTPIKKYQTPDRMAKKLRAIPIPADLTGKTVLDIGCEDGAFCRIASDRGASRVVGVDRNCPTVDWVAKNKQRDYPRTYFFTHEAGAQWDQITGAPFDVVFCFALYHHAFAVCASHHKLWAWFRSQVKDDGVFLWEGPTSTKDGIVAMRLRQMKARITDRGASYDRATILGVARRFFDVEEVGPALYRPHREVWRCTPKEDADQAYYSEGWHAAREGAA